MDTAAIFLEQAIEQRQIISTALKVWDIYNDFRSQSRCPALLKKMNL